MAVRIVVFNLKRRPSGVSSTVFALQPALGALRPDVGYYGHGIPEGNNCLSSRALMNLCRIRTTDPLVFHVRRDHEIALGLSLKRLARRPIRLVFTWAAQRPKGRLASWLTRQCDAIVATTPQAAAYAPFSTALIPHGVPLQTARHAVAAPEPTPVRIACVGRIRPEKGTDVLVDALLSILKYPFEAYIVGEAVGPRHQAFQRKLMDKIQHAGAAQRFHWVPAMAYAQMPQFFRQMHITVACPRYEGFGLTLFEAAAAGCAVIGSTTGAFPLLIGPQGQRGQLVPCGDVPALSQALARWLACPQERVEKAQQAQAYVYERFSLDHEAHALARLYDQLLLQSWKKTGGCSERVTRGERNEH